MGKRLTTVIVLAIALGAVLWGFSIIERNQSSKLSASPSPTPSTIRRTPLKTTVAPTSVLRVSATPTPSLQVVATDSPTPSVIPTPVTHATYVVILENNQFTPTPLTVHRGDAVVFRNEDNSIQSATSLNHVFDSRDLRSGEEWTLDTSTLSAGTYEYNSKYHPIIRGTLIVIE